MQNEYQLIKSQSKLDIPNTNPRKITPTNGVQLENGHNIRHVTHEAQINIPSGYRAAAVTRQRLPSNLNYQLSSHDNNERNAKTNSYIRNTYKNEPPPFIDQAIYSLRPHPAKSVTPPRPLLTLTAQTPSLIRIGQNKSSTKICQTYSTNPQPSLHAHKPQQPIQTFAADDNICARRLRGALNNHQKKVINPKISPFTSDNDFVSQLLPYHLYQDDIILNDDELKFDHENFEKETIRIASASNDIIKRLDRMFSNHLSLTINEDILLTKLFIKTEKENLQSHKLFKQESSAELPNHNSQYGTYSTIPNVPLFPQNRHS